MTPTDMKALSRDPDGLATYEYIANHINDADLDLKALVDNMIRVDTTGQFLVSAARYLHAIDATANAVHIERLIDEAIDRDHDRRYIAELLPAIWGNEYEQHAMDLYHVDRNFRRIYRRVSPTADII